MGWLFNTPEEPANEDAVAGIDVLKAIWNIQSGTSEREQPPSEVVTDIYNTPLRVVPPRNRRLH